MVNGDDGDGKRSRTLTTTSNSVVVAQVSSAGIV
jgi:hypothetical protein